MMLIKKLLMPTKIHKKLSMVSLVIMSVLNYKNTLLLYNNIVKNLSNILSSL